MTFWQVMAVTSLFCRTSLWTSMRTSMGTHRMMEARRLLGTVTYHSDVESRSDTVKETLVAKKRGI